MKPDILKELITDWKEPRTFKELEGFCKELLQNGGEFSNTTRESLLNSRDTRFTNNEVTLLQGMTLFTIKNKEQETKEKYINSINHMSQINFDLWGK